MPYHWEAQRQYGREERFKRWDIQQEHVFVGLGIDRKQARKMTLAFTGQLVWPWDPDYNRARQLIDPLFDDYPLLVAYCAVWNDVRLCLEWAQTFGLKATCRSGGNSTAGFSANTAGIIIDVSRLSYVAIDPHDKTAVVGAGTNMGVLAKAMQEYQLHTPIGECPTVCVGGYAQGGGYGLSSRKFGMNCDNILAAKIMLTDGRVVAATSTINPDLFWAIRGGTGNNFGVLLEVTYQLHNISEPVWGVGLSWPLEDAAEALSVLQESYTQNGPDDFCYYAMLMVLPEKEQPDTPSLVVRGVYFGSRTAGLEAIAPLLHLGRPTIQIDQIDSFSKLKPLIMAGIPNVPGKGGSLLKGTGYVDRPLEWQEWQQIVDYFKTTPNPYSIFAIEPYGGAINRRDPHDMAFIHRQVYLDVFIDGFYRDEHELQIVDKWLTGFSTLMADFFSGHQYQNYPERDRPNYREAYWGEAFGTLLKIKCKYNPTDIFRFQQSITPSGTELDNQILLTLGFDFDPQAINMTL